VLLLLFLPGVLTGVLHGRACFINSCFTDGIKCCVLLLLLLLLPGVP
jgi:hypothetical protein